MFAANTDLNDRQFRNTDARNDERSSKEEKGRSPKRSGAWIVVNTRSFAIQIITRHIYFRDLFWYCEYDVMRPQRIAKSLRKKCTLKIERSNH